MAYKVPGVYAHFENPIGDVNTPGKSRLMALVGTGQRYFERYNIPMVKSLTSPVDILPNENVLEIFSLSSQPIINNKISPLNTVYKMNKDVKLVDGKYLSWNTLPSSTAEVKLLPGHGNVDFMSKISVVISSNPEFITDGLYKLEISYIDPTDATSGTYRIINANTNELVGDEQIVSNDTNFELIKGIGIKVTSTFIPDLTASPYNPKSLTNIGDYVYIETKAAKTQIEPYIESKLGYHANILNFNKDYEFDFNMPINQDVANAIYKMKFYINGVPKKLGDIFDSFSITLSGTAKGIEQDPYEFTTDNVGVPLLSLTESTFADCSTLGLPKVNYNALSLLDNIKFTIKAKTKTILSTSSCKLLFGIVKNPTDLIEGGSTVATETFNFKVVDIIDQDSLLVADKDKALFDIVQDIRVINAKNVIDANYVIKLTDIGQNEFSIFKMDNGGFQTKVGTYKYDQGPVFAEAIPGIVFTLTDKFSSNPNLTETTKEYDIKNDDGSAMMIITHAGISSPGVPAEGATYYISYRYTKSESSYEPKVFYEYDDVIAEYGQYNVTASGKVINSLTLGAEIAFFNGARPVICVQAKSDSDYDMKQAITKLEKPIPGLGDVSSVIPLTTSKDIGIYTMNHVDNMSSFLNTKYRMAYLGAAFKELVSKESTVFDKSMGSIQTAQSYQNERIVYVVPGGATKEVMDPATGVVNIRPVPGCYLAVAVASIGLRNDPAEPLTNKTVAGFKDLINYYTETEMNSMAENGCCILVQKGSSIKIRHGITTYTASINSSEITLIQIRDYVITSIKDSLGEMYIGKKLKPTIIADIDYSLNNLLSQLVNQDIIISADNVVVKRSKLDSRQVDIRFTIEAVYPLNYIDISFGFSTASDIVDTTGIF